MASRLWTTVVCALLLALAAQASREPFRLPSQTTGDSVVESAQPATLVSHGRQLKQSTSVPCPECRCLGSIDTQSASRSPSCAACFISDADGMKCWDNLPALGPKQDPVIINGLLYGGKDTIDGTVEQFDTDAVPVCSQCLVIFA